MFQEPCLFSHLSVLGNIDYAYKRAGIPMLYVSHDPWEMYELADRVLILNGEGPISPVSMPRFREYVDLLLAGCGKAESRDIPLNRVQCQG